MPMEFRLGYIDKSICEFVVIFKSQSKTELLYRHRSIDRRQFVATLTHNHLPPWGIERASYLLLAINKFKSVYFKSNLSLRKKLVRLPLNR